MSLKLQGGDEEARDEVGGEGEGGPRRFPAVVAAAPGCLALLILVMGPQRSTGVPALVLVAVCSLIALGCFGLIAAKERDGVARNVGFAGLIVTMAAIGYRLLFMFA